jgi:hypothetical protein
MTYYDNDEDLFNYDPDSELNVQDSINSSSEQDPIESALSNSGLEFFKAKTAISFLEAQGTWFDSSFLQNSATNKAAHIVLDELTDGRFSLLKLYFDIEANLSRKKDILYIVKKFYNAVASSGTKNISIKIDDSSLNLDISILFSFINNNINIISHACINLRPLYFSLSQKLGLDHNPDLMLDYEDDNEDHNLDSDNMAFILSKIFSKSYSSDYSSHLRSVYSEIYNTLSEEGIIDIIKSINSFSGDVELC